MVEVGTVVTVLQVRKLTALLRITVRMEDRQVSNRPRWFSPLVIFFHPIPLPLGAPYRK